jgi:hypothetical protein
MEDRVGFTARKPESQPFGEAVVHRDDLVRGGEYQTNGSRGKCEKPVLAGIHLELTIPQTLPLLDPQNRLCIRPGVNEPRSRREGSQGVGGPRYWRGRSGAWIQAGCALREYDVPG